MRTLCALLICIIATQGGDMRDRMPRWFKMASQVEKPVWRDYANCKKRSVKVLAGRRAYKTEVAKRKLVMSTSDLKRWDDPIYYYCAPTYKQAKRVGWKHLKALMPKPWVADISEVDLTIVTKFGSELRVVGLDSPERMEGGDADGVVVDERCDVKDDAINISILPCLAYRKGWLWETGVPKRHGVGSKTFREQCEAIARSENPEEEFPDDAYFTWMSNEVLTEAQLDFFRSRMTAMDYAEQFEASWQTVGGQIFYAFDSTPISGNVRTCDFHSDLPLIIGSDFNVCPMAWVLGHQVGQCVEWFDEIWENDTNTRACLDILWQKYGQYCKAGARFYGDASSRNRHTSASQSDYDQITGDSRFQSIGATVHYTKANPPVLDRIAACNAMLLSAAGHRRLYVDPKCEHLITDLQVRGYMPNSMVPADKGDIGHPTDAMGYPIWMLYPAGYESMASSVPAIFTVRT